MGFPFFVSKLKVPFYDAFMFYNIIKQGGLIWEKDLEAFVINVEKKKISF